eukprot:TRINITY_DN654_c2_g1_i1.p2 TRINITY_DN654_c2_g1~~TRINITY_DN654_c2_g1_i1.p2  ORF type:complete len:142 (+),score=23.71 TRINITY_DN654_c2_g1_i1:606-1031(+)
MACELKRPVSVHCVDASGAMFDFFQARELLPPAIAMHSYGGSADSAKRFLNLPGGKGKRFYFGFSWCINTRSHRLISTIKGIPLEHILLESDRPSTHNIDVDLWKMCELVADVHQTTIDIVASITRSNSLRFLHCILPENL